MSKTKKTAVCNNGEPCLLAADIERLRQEVQQLSELVSTDNLTGLNNYRYFTQVITQEIERSQRTGQPTTLMMVDADHFKQVNDRWGHETGNRALKLIADCLQHNIRKLDIACRYGGEEFAIILPSTDIGTSLQVAERIRNTVEQTPLMVDAETTHPLTISIGIAAYTNRQQDGWQKLVERADKELYRAKQEGRNRVCYLAEEASEQQINADEKAALFTIFQDREQH